MFFSANPLTSFVIFSCVFCRPARLLVLSSQVCSLLPLSSPSYFISLTFTKQMIFAILFQTVKVASSPTEIHSNLTVY